MCYQPGTHVLQGRGCSGCLRTACTIAAHVRACPIVYHHPTSTRSLWDVLIGCTHPVTTAILTPGKLVWLLDALPNTCTTCARHTWLPSLSSMCIAVAPDCRCASATQRVAYRCSCRGSYLLQCKIPCNRYMRSRGPGAAAGAPVFGTATQLTTSRQHGTVTNRRHPAMPPRRQEHRMVSGQHGFRASAWTQRSSVHSSSQGGHNDAHCYCNWGHAACLPAAARLQPRSVSGSIHPTHFTACCDGLSEPLSSSCSAACYPTRLDA